MSGARGFERYLTGELNLFTVDLDTGAMETLSKGRFDTGAWVLGPNHTVIARETGRDVSQAYAIHNDLQGGASLLEVKDPFGEVSLIGPGRGPNTILVWRHKLEEYALDTGKSVEIALDGDFGGIAYDSTQQRAIGVEILGDINRFQAFDDKLAARVRALGKAIPGRITPVTWSDDFSSIILYADGDGDAGTYWLVNGHAANPLGYAYPDLPDAEVGKVRVVPYAAADGAALRAIVTYPPGPEPKNAPVVVMPHGGPEAHDSLGFDWMAQAFASRGYVVIQPNFRGSGGYGLEFRNAGFGEWGAKMQTDVSDALATLARQGVVDPRRACIVGASYGGYVALAGVTVQKGLYRCAVSVAGISDLSYFMNEILYRQGGEERNAETRYFREYLGDKTTIAARSPVKLAEQADAPILLIHGTEDVVVPIQQSREMEAALRKAGKPVEVVTLPKEDHWLSREEGRRAMLEAAMAFVLKYNPPN